MRTCEDCGEPKPTEAFAPDGRRSDGLSPRCLACRDERRRASRRKHQATSPNRAASQRAWREKNPDYAKQWAAKNPGKARAYQIKSLYGITVEQYDAMYEAQGGICAICAKPGDPLRVDHDHETNEVRGLLCHNCNVALGIMGDDSDRLVVAAAYLLAKERV